MVVKLNSNSFSLQSQYPRCEDTDSFDHSSANIQLSFLIGADGTKLVKSFGLDADGNISKSNYPNVYRFDSVTVKAASLQDLYIQARAYAYHGSCLQKGALDRDLKHEPRAGHTHADQATRWLCLDNDGLPLKPAELLQLLGLEGVSYIVHRSASSGITTDIDASYHIFVLLDRAYTPAEIKRWLRHINLSVPEIRQHVRLNKAKMALRYGLDVTVNQSDKLIYIGTPVIGDGVACALSEDKRWQLVELGRELAILPIPEISDSELDRLTKDLVDELRAAEGLPARTPELRQIDGFDVEIGSRNQVQVTGVKQRGEFTYLNLNGGDSWGYYHLTDHPEVLRNFKGEPNYLLKEIAPGYYYQTKVDARADGGATRGVAIAETVIDAVRQREDWRAVLHACEPSASELDVVLDELSHQPGLSKKKTALKRDYRDFTADVASAETLAEIKAAGKVAIEIDRVNLAEFVYLVETTVLGTPGRTEWLRFGGAHVYVDVRQPRYAHGLGGTHIAAPPQPILCEYDARSLTLRVSESCTFYGDVDGIVMPMDVPTDIGGLLMSRPLSEVPQISGLLTHPTVLENGEVLMTPGHDEQTGLFCSFKPDEFEHPGDMTAKEGAKILCDELLNEFEFATPEDEAAAVAYIVTGVVRKVLRIAPAFLVNSPSQSSGKTTLASTVCVLLTGHSPSVMAWRDEEAEIEKRMLSTLKENPSAVVFDNIRDGWTVSGDAFANVLTHDRFSARTLGASANEEVPTNVMFALTGNNLKLSRDLSFRVVEIRLDPTTDRPDARRFERTNFVQHILANRARFVKAALAIAANGDKTALDGVTNRRYEDWNRAVRWPVANALGVDPGICLERSRENSPEVQRNTAWLRGLVAGFGISQEPERLATRKEFKASDLTAIEKILDGLQIYRLPKHSSVVRMEAMADTLMEHPPAKGWRSVKSVAHMLGDLVDKKIGGVVLRRVSRGGTDYYHIEQYADVVADHMRFEFEEPDLHADEAGRSGRQPRPRVIDFDAAKARASVSDIAL